MLHLFQANSRSTYNLWKDTDNLISVVLFMCKKSIIIIGLVLFCIMRIQQFPDMIWSATPSPFRIILFLAPAVTVGETEGAMDCVSVFFLPLLLPITL